MERLTERVGEYVKIKGNTTIFSDKERYRAYLHNAIIRLAAYEDTGLEPEEIDSIFVNSVMEENRRLKDELNRVQNKTNGLMNLDELREMVGEPVYIYIVPTETYKGRVISRVGELLVFFTDGTHINTKEYGKNWFAYCRKPEES